MACDDRQCLAPQERSLRWKLEGYTDRANDPSGNLPDTLAENPSNDTSAQGNLSANGTMNQGEIREKNPSQVEGSLIRLST